MKLEFYDRKGNLSKVIDSKNKIQLAVYRMYFNAARMLLKQTRVCAFTTGKHIIIHRKSFNMKNIFVGAVIAHELGHIQHNDLPRKLRLKFLWWAVIKRKGAMVIDPHAEAKADAYAVSMYGDIAKYSLINLIQTIRGTEITADYRLNCLFTGVITPAPFNRVFIDSTGQKHPACNQRDYDNFRNWVLQTYIGSEITEALEKSND